VNRAEELTYVEDMMNKATQSVGATWKWVDRLDRLSSFMPIAWAEIKVVDSTGTLTITTPTDYLEGVHSERAV